MRIVHAIPALTRGGAERVVVDLANHAAERGHQVTILTAVPAPAELLPGPLHAAVELRHVAPRASSRRLAYAQMPAWLARNRHWLLSQDVIHGHLTFGSVFGTVAQWMRAVHRRRVPVVVETYHAIGAPIPNSVRRFHMRLARGHDGLVTMAADPAWTDFQQRNPKLESILIPNGIALPVDRPAAAESVAYRAQLGIPPDALVLGTVGRLVPERRPADLLEVFVRVAAALPNVHFLIGGEGPERALIEQGAARAGLERRVHLAGLVERPPLPFSVTDLYLSLNVGAITGIAALEAAAMGVPLIAFQAQPGHRLGPDDWIFSSADHQQLADEALRLLADAPARHSLAQRQQSHVLQHHDAGAMAEAYFAFYERLLANARGPRR
jgi:glycosyltransferase involved in cell wall biosynthesis